VALAARERFDVIVMDVQMPVMDGLEATRRIRRLSPPAGAVPIVGLSANVLEEERRRYLAAGMDRCLTKPIAWPELFSALAEAARSAGRAPPVPDPDAKGPQPPLLDSSAARLTADAVSMELLHRVVADTERCCERMGACPSGSPEQLEEAHRLKGTAGLFGLRRVSAAAAEVEARARGGQGTAEAMARLAAAIAATRDELAAAHEVSRGSPEGGPIRPLEKEVP
jgi:response regulator RpfG family c-di-GMP phosphodiesterase